MNFRLFLHHSDNGHPCASEGQNAGKGHMFAPDDHSAFSWTQKPVVDQFLEGPCGKDPRRPCPGNTSRLAGTLKTPGGQKNEPAFVGSCSLRRQALKTMHSTRTTWNNIQNRGACMDPDGRFLNQSAQFSCIGRPGIDAFAVTHSEEEMTKPGNPPQLFFSFEKGDF